MDNIFKHKMQKAISQLQTAKNYTSSLCSIYKNIAGFSAIHYATFRSRSLLAASLVKTSIHICSTCIEKLYELISETLKNTPEKLAEQNDQHKHKKDRQPMSKSNLTLKTQIRLWEEFSDFEIDDNECITKPFIHKPYLAFPAGTHREEIWHWFEDNGPLSAYQLLYEIDDFIE